MHPIQDLFIFWKFFICTIIWYAFLYAPLFAQNFILVKSGCYTGQVFVTPLQQMILHPSIFRTPNTGNQNVQRTPSTQNATSAKVNTTCFDCGQKGHYANHFLSRRRSSTPTPRTPAPPPNRNGALPRPKLSRTMLEEEWIKWLWRKLITPQPW
jgi:hypothetical protein